MGVRPAARGDAFNGQRRRARGSCRGRGASSFFLLASHGHSHTPVRPPRQQKQARFGLAWGREDPVISDELRGDRAVAFIFAVCDAPWVVGSLGAPEHLEIFSDRPFEEIGFNTKVPQYALPPYTWTSLSKIPMEIVGFVAVLGGLAYIRNRGSKGGE